MALRYEDCIIDPVAPSYGFFSELARVINAGQSRSIVLAGDVHDLFFAPTLARKAPARLAESTRATATTNTATGRKPPEPEAQVLDQDASTNAQPGEYVPLLSFLTGRCRVEGILLIVYELNGPIRFLDEDDRRRMRDLWIRWRTGIDFDRLTLKALNDSRAHAQRESLKKAFDDHLVQAVGRPTAALEFLRQLTLCSRQQRETSGLSLMILIEAADLLLPAGDGDITRLSPADRHRISVITDWFSDPGFMDGYDSVLLLAESRALLHPRITRLPQLHTIEVPAPETTTRAHYIHWLLHQMRAAGRSLPHLADPPSQLAAQTAGLSIHAIRQMLIRAAHTAKPVTAATTVDRVEDYVIAQLGEGVVEFTKPAHTLADVMGYRRLKAFLREEMMPRIQSTGDDALPGAAVAGPIGAGKTFIFEAMAGELGLPVLVLKNIRSQYFGQTDVLFERLRRVIEALGRVLIFVDEADTQFGGVGRDTHETERRLTGRIQQMMSDPKLRGRVSWLLMTARIEALSPDIRRPGRVGDLIIPVLDPEGDDRRDFLRWTIEPALADDAGEVASAMIDELEGLTAGYSSAAFASLRSRLRARRMAARQPLSIDDIRAIVHDQLMPDIGPTRRYQTLQALVNCTRRSLLPDPGVDEAAREAWVRELRTLEAAGLP